MATRRNFIKTTGLFAASLLLPWTPSVNIKKSNAPLRFGICTDIHQDVIHDAESRLKSFICDAKENEVDFIIQLGDFCFPLPGNDGFMDTWNGFKGPAYHVLGNHDMDINTKPEAQDYWGMEASYYSFDKGGFRFIVLDANYLHKNGKFIDYAEANYFDNYEDQDHISRRQLEWLERELNHADKPCIIFSHQSLAHPYGVKNQVQVRNILEVANLRPGPQRVIACFSGHHHTDHYRAINGIHYLELNSMSYRWLGEDYSHARFSDKIHKEYPNVDKVAPYKDPLYAFVEISSEGLISISGKKSKFISPDPFSLGFPHQPSYNSVVPHISNRAFRRST